ARPVGRPAAHRRRRRHPGLTGGSAARAAEGGVPSCPAEVRAEQNAEMSNLDPTPVPRTCGGRSDTPGGPVLERIPGREVTLGESTQVRRLLPTLGRRMVGAWCFLDHYGPDDITDEPGMQVPPHPHIGLQTV